MSSHTPNRWLALISVMVAFLPIVLDMTILHVAIPSLTLALQASGTGVLWIIDMYPLVMASLLIPMGTLADRIGHRKMMITGLSIFALGSVLAAFSPNVGALVATRALMAVGAAMVMPCTLAIVRQAFEDERERAIALGLWGTVASAGAAIGPLVGGALLEHFWWGSVFLVNVPVMLVVIPLVFAFSPQRSTVSDGDWTIRQALVLMLGIMASVYALKSSFKADSSVLVTVAAFVIGLTLLGGFVHKQLHATRPMLDLSLFSHPALAAGVAMGFVVMAALAGVELMLAQELQFVLGRSPLQAGIFLLPLMLASAVGGPLAGVMMRVLSLRVVASLSLVVSAASLVGLALMRLDGSALSVGLLLAALGLSLSTGWTASSVAIMSNTPVEKAGSAGALEATSYDLGAGLGITIFGLLLTSVYQRSIRLPDDLPASVAAHAGQSIRETMTAATTLDAGRAGELIQAGHAAFGASHSVVLLCAAALIGVLSVIVWVMLRRRPDTV